MHEICMALQVCLTNRKLTSLLLLLCPSMLQVYDHLTKYASFTAADQAALEQQVQHAKAEIFQNVYLKRSMGTKAALPLPPPAPPPRL